MTVRHFFHALKPRSGDLTLCECDFSCVELHELFYTRDLYMNIFPWQSRRFAHRAMLIGEVGLISHSMLGDTDLLQRETEAEQEGR